MAYKDKEKQKEYQRDWVAKKKQNNQDFIYTIKENVNIRRRSRKKEISDLKESTPCFDCDKFFQACIMDFDHIEDNKISNISRMVNNNASWEKIYKEIAKCQLVCANCHRLRTWNRRYNIQRCL